MTFLVEDGTGLENATAYAAVATVDAYWVDRANTAWAAATNGAKQAAIIKATDYIDLRWGDRLKGYRYAAAQALAFPRSYLYDADGFVVEGIPTKLVNAVAEYALRALTNELLTDPTVEDNGLQIASKTEKAGPVEESVTYVQGAVQTLKPYPAADRWVRGYINTGDAVVRA